MKHTFVDAGILDFGRAWQIALCCEGKPVGHRDVPRLIALCEDTPRQVIDTLTPLLVACGELMEEHESHACSAKAK